MSFSLPQDEKSPNAHEQVRQHLFDRQETPSRESRQTHAAPMKRDPAHDGNSLLGQASVSRLQTEVPHH